MKGIRGIIGLLILGFDFNLLGLAARKQDEEIAPPYCIVAP